MLARRFHQRALLLLVVARVVGWPIVPVHAQQKPAAPAAKPEASGPATPSNDATKAEAASRFERGLKLFNSGDNSGALAEFKRIYEILPNPVVLFNIGLVYAAMGRPVDAVDALEIAVQSGKLSGNDLERAQQTLADQKARVARLVVTTVPEGAQVEIDSVQVAKTPLSGPIRIAEGTHVVGAVLAGYAPSRKEIVVAGNVEAKVHLELASLQGKQLANLSVRSPIPGAQVRVDGKPSGRTPLTTSITLPAGRHVVELSRPGYVSGRREIDLGAGATGEVALDLGVDESALATEGAMLVIESSESPLDLSVDGKRRGNYTGPIRLPRGPHRLAVTAAGFVPAERDVNLDPSVTNVVRFDLEPTPETREAHRSTAMFHRTWGFIGIIGGAALGGVGATFVVLGSSQKAEGEEDHAAVASKDKNGRVAPCDWRADYEESGGTRAQCDQAYNDAQSKIDSGRTKSTLGFVGIGVGGALAVTGLVLLLTGDDPDKYGPARDARLTIVPGPGLFGGGIRTSF